MGGAATVTKVIFAGGTSAQELTLGGSSAPVVEYIRGSDYGGGVGGTRYTLRGGIPSYTHYNNRGDVVAKTAANGSLTYEAQYEAYGKRTAEQGSTDDRQKANTKDEDSTGLLNQGFRYRDLETGTFITRDPLMFVEGPNMYAYVVQNPWTKFDPEGLSYSQDVEDFYKGYFFDMPVSVATCTAGAIYNTGTNLGSGESWEAAKSIVLDPVGAAKAATTATLQAAGDFAGKMDIGSDATMRECGKMTGGVVLATVAVTDLALSKAGIAPVQSAKDIAKALPDEANVVRGGLNTPKNIKGGSAVTIDA